MNTVNFLILFKVVVAVQLSYCYAENDCKGVTVGECTIPDNDIIITVGVLNDVQDCQSYCEEFEHCKFFKFDGQHCTLLRKDYRKDCQIFAGGYDKTIDECLKIDIKPTCDHFIEENCNYTGDVFLDPPMGDIVDRHHCEELCNEFQDIGCKSWIFSNTEKQCSLRINGKRDCKIIGGPKSPSLEDCKIPCMGCTHAPTPITTKTTTMSSTPMITTTPVPICPLVNGTFMNASSLRDCLTRLGANSTFHQIEYIETHYGNDEYLDQVCRSINPLLAYDKEKTEGQPDDCPSNKDGWMYPSYCSFSGYDGFLMCDSIHNGCLWPNYPGFYCKDTSNDLQNWRSNIDRTKYRKPQLTSKMTSSEDW